MVSAGQGWSGSPLKFGSNFYNSASAVHQASGPALAGASAGGSPPVTPPLLSPYAAAFNWQEEGNAEEDLLVAPTRLLHFDAEEVSGFVASITSQGAGLLGSVHHLQSSGSSSLNFF
jgi:hypothetical protein